MNTAIAPLETIRNALNYHIHVAERELSEFRENLALHAPAYYFQGADKVMFHAAKHRVCNIILESLADDTRSAVRAAYILKEGRRKVESFALNPPRSTSPCNNLMKQYEAQAWAELLEEGHTIRDALLILSQKEG